MNIEKVSQEFAKDLIKLVNSFKGLTYNGKVSYGNTRFEYVTLDKILSVIKNNDDFAVLEPLGTDTEGRPALQVILIHKTGESITSDYYALRVPDNAKKQDEGAAITYTKRYALGSFLGLCTDEDNDANPTGTGMPAKAKPSATKKEIAQLTAEISAILGEDEKTIKLAAANTVGVKGVNETELKQIKKYLEEWKGNIK